MHGVNFGCSDIYVVAVLRPLSSDITRCQREISKCAWMPIEEYLTHEQVHDTNKMLARKYVECRSNGVSVAEEEIELKFKSFQRKMKVYTIKREDKT